MNGNVFCRTLLVFLLLPLFLAQDAPGDDDISLLSAEVTPTFNAAGIRISYGGDDNGNATASLSFREVGEASWRQGHPPSRILSKRFASSIFNLEAGTAYEAQVTVSDPDGVTGSPKTLSFETRAESFPTGSGGHLWVSPDGDDDNNGSQAYPFRTLQRAHVFVTSGTVVHVLPGTYREGVTILRSGTSSAYNSWRAEGSGVIINGADEKLERIDQVDDWHPDGSVYWAAVDWTTQHVASDGERLWRYGSLQDLRNNSDNVPGGYYQDEAAGRLYVFLPTGHDPDLHSMAVARISRAFYLWGASYNIVEGFELKNFGTDAWGKGVYIRDGTSEASYNVIRNNTIRYCTRGVWVKGTTARHNLIEKNDLQETTVADLPWGLVKGSEAEGPGICLQGGEGTVVRNNTVSGFFDGIAPSTFEDPWNEAYNRSIDIHGNTLHHFGDDGLEPEGACVNIRMWDNEIHNTLAGISVAPVNVGPTYAIRNVMYDYRRTCFKFSNDQAGPCYLYHNSAYAGNPDVSAILTSGGWSNITSKNNIYSGTSWVIEDYNVGTGNLFDSDCLHTTHSSRFVRWGGVDYGTIAAFRTATGQETSGLRADPLYADPANGDLSLQEGSPCLGTASPIPNVSDGWIGGGPDLGAFENMRDPDLDGDGGVGASDLGMMMSMWATSQDDADLDLNGTVEAVDLEILTDAWTA